jgi:hypothetical protein
MIEGLRLRCLQEYDFTSTIVDQKLRLVAQSDYTIKATLDLRFLADEVPLEVETVHWFPRTIHDSLHPIRVSSHVKLRCEVRFGGCCQS